MMLSYNAIDPCAMLELSYPRPEIFYRSLKLVYYKVRYTLWYIHHIFMQNSSTPSENSSSPSTF